MTSNGDWIAQHNLLRVDYAMLSLTSIVFLARIGVQIWRRKNVETQDICLYIAFLAYLAFTILYIVITPIFFKIQALQAEKLAPWPTMMEDIKFASKVMWSSGMEYWTCLWFVKFSLLALYKKLLVGMPRGYVKIWWATLVFCIVTWATCIITGPGLACDNTKKFFDEGVLCSSPAETRRQTANLYYAYAVDTLSNLMVMFLPIRLIWNLQMEQAKKIGCGLLFASGFICILFSTIRVVQVGEDGTPRSPDPKWLTMWTIIECSTAVVIGCCPVLASSIPRIRSASRNIEGYVRSQRHGSATPSNRIMGVLSSRNKERDSEKTSANISESKTGRESLEELPPPRTGGTGIRITPQMQEEHQRRMEDAKRKKEQDIEVWG